MLSEWFSELFIFIFLKIIDNMKALYCVIFEELHLVENFFFPVQRFHLCISAKVFEFIQCMINKTRIRRHYHFETESIVYYCIKD